MIFASIDLKVADAAALAFFVLAWVLFAFAASGRRSNRTTLTQAMNRPREQWMRTMARRERRMIDTGIMAGRRAGTAFFASTCILVSLGYLGWFIGPAVFALTTSLVFVVLVRHQFFSEARAAATGWEGTKVFPVPLRAHRSATTRRHICSKAHCSGCSAFRSRSSSCSG